MYQLKDKSGDVKTYAMWCREWKVFFNQETYYVQNVFHFYEKLDFKESASRVAGDMFYLPVAMTTTA